MSWQGATWQDCSWEEVGSQRGPIWTLVPPYRKPGEISVEFLRERGLQRRSGEWRKKLSRKKS